MIPVPYRYEMLKKWSIEHNYKIAFLSRALFGSTKRIDQLRKLGERRFAAKYDEEWELISNFTGLNFNDPFECEELRNIITYLTNHLDKYGNTILSLKVYQSFESVDLVKYLQELGYKVNISFVSHRIEKTVVIQLVK